MPTSKAKPRRKLADTQRTLDYKKVFEADEGQRVLRDLMIGFNFGHNVYAPGDDPMTVAFRDGQRSVVLHILHTLGIEVDPVDAVRIIQMQREDYGLHLHEHGESS